MKIENGELKIEEGKKGAAKVTGGAGKKSAVKVAEAAGAEDEYEELD